MVWPVLAALGGSAGAGGGILASPWLHLGLGILGQGNKPGGNLATGALQGLNSYNQYNRQALTTQLLNQQLKTQLSRDESRKTLAGMLTPEEGQPQPTARGIYSKMLTLPGYENTGMQGILSMMEGQDPTSLMQNAQAMGLRPGTPEYADFLRQAILKPSSQVNVNMGDKGISATDALRYVNAQGEHPPVGTPHAQAVAAGYTLQSSEQQKTDISKREAMNVVNTLDRLAIGTEEEPGVFANIEPGMGPLLSRGEFGWENLVQTDPRYRDYLSFSRATVAPLIRSLGEKGTLAEGDVERALGLVPKPGDTGEVARRKIENLKNLLRSKGALDAGSTRKRYNPATGRVE